MRLGAAQAQAVLAAGASDPRRVARWAADPAALTALGLAPGGLDLPALRGFGGLAMKVRHNGLRDIWPSSFRLLDVAGLEIELFADWALAVARRGRGLASGDEARAVELIDFVSGWHDPAQPAQAQLWDLLRHEQTLFELARAGAGAPTAATARPTPAARPVVQGRLRLHEMRHDPQALVQALRAREPDLAAVAAAPRLLGYWRPAGDDAIHLVELDAFGFAALQAADGCRSVAGLSQALGLPARPPRRVMVLLEQLADAGLLVFTRGAP